MKRTPRGIRNNNPGNIRYNGIEWRGLATPPSDGTFCVFKTAHYGIRALARLLMNYHHHYGLRTVNSLINRFAPPNENDTESYINNVCKNTGFNAHTQLDMTDKNVICELVKAIIKQENGVQPYSEIDIEKGVIDG